MPYFLIGKKELIEEPELIYKLANLLIEDSREDRGKHSWEVRDLDLKTSRKLIRKNILEYGNVFLISLNAKGIPEGHMVIDFPPYKGSYVTVLHTFVSSKFRRQRVATRLTFRLIGISRRLGYSGIEKGLRVPGALKLGEKMLLNPRKVIGAEGKPTGQHPEKITIVPHHEDKPEKPFKVIGIEFKQRKKRTKAK